MVAGTDVPVPAHGGSALNATCAGAVISSLAVGVPVTVNGDNSGAVQDPVLGVPVVWEAFTTVQCADVTVGYCGTTPSFAGSLITLGVGCPLTNFVYNSTGNIQSGACGDGNFTILFPNLPAGTYYFPVLQGAGSIGPYTITFTATACSATPPQNAFCAGAIALPSEAECTPVAGTVAFATAAGNTGLGCGNGDVADGVWYTFEATSEAYALTVAPSAQFNVHIEVFSGTCSALTSIACSIGDNFGLPAVVQLSNLVIGDTYYVRVNDWYSGNPVTTTFFLCLETVATVTCDADAGSMTAVDDEVCLQNGQATIGAIPNGDAGVPAAYLTLYLLTTGTDPVIQQGALTPSFVVSGPGTYTVHTLVYDNTTLDLNGLVFGTTTAASINALLVQGGGPICASLDLVGAVITVQDCDACPADAGSLNPNASTVCINNGSATIDATPEGNAVVPAGYEFVYLLTTGPDLIIQQGAFTPAFIVTQTGQYTMHTIVYDPATLDLTTVVFGVTSGLDVNAQLIQGGGTVCAGLDVVGAPVSVEVCSGLIDEQRPGGWSIWPTPNNGRFQLSGTSTDAFLFLQVFGPDGRLVHELPMAVHGGGAITVGLPDHLAPGIYTVRIQGGDEVVSMRMVLE